MTNGWFTPDAETTGAIPAATPADELSATQPAGPLASSPELTPHPGPPLKRTPGPAAAAAEAGRLDDPTADAFHLVDCACADPYGVAGHVEEYGPLAEMTRKTVIAAAVAAGEVVPAEQIVPRRYPVEAKVAAGGKGALWAGLGVGLATLLLNHLGAIGSLYGGEFPWLGGVLAVAAVVLPAAIGTWQGYDAPHTPRPGVQR